MTALDRLLNGRGVSQYALALHLGVSRQAVSQWVRGSSPLPADRVPDIAHALDCSESELQADTAFDPDAEPFTFFGWLFANDGLLFDLGRTPLERMDEVAEATGTDVSYLKAWAAGRKLIPLDWAHGFMARFLSGINPVVLKDAVTADNRFIETDAVQLWASGVGASTFEEAERSLSEAKARWLRGIPVDKNDLDDGRPVPASVVSRMERYR